MNKKRPIPKWLIVIIVIWAFFALNIILTVLRNISSPAPATQNETTTETSSEVPEEEKPTVAKLNDILDSLNIKYEDLNICQDDSDKPQYIIRYLSDDTFWNEKAFVIDNISNYVKICAEAYQIDDINKIELIIYCKMTDARGNEDEDLAFDMCMLKDNYDKYNWKNLEYSKINYDALKSDCEELYIHPSISKNVNFDDLYYK